MAVLRRVELQINKPAVGETVQGPQLEVRWDAKAIIFTGEGIEEEFPVDSTILDLEGHGSHTVSGPASSHTFNVDSPGTKTVRVTARANGKQKIRKRTFDLVLDTGAPTIKILGISGMLDTVEVEAGLNVFSGPGPSYSLKVTGEARDEFKIAAVRCNGQSVDTTEQSDKLWRWHKELTFSGARPHSVNAIVSDTVGNERAASLEIQTIDSGPPVLEITSHSTDRPELRTWTDTGLTENLEGIARDDTSGVKVVEFRLNEGPFDDVTNVSGDWLRWRIPIVFPGPGLHDVTVRATDNAEVSNLKVIRFDIAVPFELDDLNQAAYLADLISFAGRRVRSSEAGPPIDAQILGDTFHQPFARLTESSLRQAAQEPVTQVRIAVEVLRGFLDNRTRIASYCIAAYQTLLANLGTSYEEVRLARGADEPIRAELAARLGIAPDGLEKLLLPAEKITESNLQRVFGLVDTTAADVLASPTDVSELLALQLAHLRSVWHSQDERESQRKDIQPFPVLDPDIVGQDDLASPVSGNVAFDLRLERENFVLEKLAEIRSARGEPGSQEDAFDRIVHLVLGEVDLFQLEEEYNSGADIEAQLRELHLYFGSLLLLTRTGNLARDGSLLDSEWEDAEFVLLAVEKRRRFIEWIQQELNAGVSLGPDHFKLSESIRELPRWRATWSDRSRWEKKLAGRINQDKALKRAHRQLIEATEESTLPLLRDALIASIDRQGFPDVDLGHWLTQRLSISLKYGGGQRLTRLEQATETLQDVLFGLRTGRLATVQDTPIGRAAPAWELALEPGDPANDDPGYSETDFDEEMKWMGAYATWRGAMFAFAYPGNYLQPTLRPKDLWTRAFAELVRSVRRDWPLTRSDAESLASDYLKKLALPSPDGDGIELDIRLTSALTSEEIATRRDQSREALQDSIDPDTGGLVPDPPPHLTEAYFYVPMLLALWLQRSGEYQAALDWFQTVYAYDQLPDDRKIYFGLIAEEALPTVYRRSFSWLLDGLNTHDIAGDRANAFTRFTLISIVRCFLGFADAEFTRETNESTLRARGLYLTALDLLDLLQPPPPVGYWALDEGAGTTAADKTGNGHAAILHEADWTTDGWQGGAISFDGPNARLEVPHAPALDIGGSGSSFSICLAMFLRQGATGEVRTIFRKGPTDGETSDHAAPALLLSADDNSILFQLTPSAGGRSNHEIETNTWKHITLVKNDTQLKLYLDGQLDSVQPLPFDALTGTTAPIQFGGDGQGNGIDAVIDEIRVFNRVLTPEAVIMLAGIDPFPPNPVVLGLRKHAEVNLQKLREGRNIAGMERPRAEPAAELIAGEGGLLPPTIALRPTQYRYPALIERSKELVGIAQQVEASFLAALEKRDNEAYNLFNAEQDVELTKERLVLEDLRVTEADGEIELMGLQKDRAQTQSDTYEAWINAGQNEHERKMLQNYRQLKNRRNVVAGLDAELTIVQAAASAAGGGFLGTGLGAHWGAVAGIAGFAAARYFAIKQVNDAEMQAQINSFNASFERRNDEWKLQRSLAQKDLEIGTQQIAQARLHKQIVEQERLISTVQADQAEAVVKFLNNKFTNVELYEWMSGILAEVYSYFLQQATAMAQLAQSQIAFERQSRPPAFIQGDYWLPPSETAVRGGAEAETDRRGLTGSVRLLQDLYQLDQFAFDTNKRKLQLTQTFSLSRLAPFELQSLRETGVLSFATPMELFDQAFPGHYLRLIKRVLVSIVALVPPSQGIRATLIAAGLSRVVTGGEAFETIEVRRPAESIAFTSPVNATGLFEMQPDNSFLLPFEAMGVDSRWELRIPKAANGFDYESLTDVLFTIEYTSLDSDTYRQQIVQRLNREVRAERAYSFQQDFPDLWYQLHNPETDADGAEADIRLSFELQPAELPPNIQDVRIDNLVLYFVREQDDKFEVQLGDLRFQQQGQEVDESFGAATTSGGVISTRKTNGAGWLPLIGRPPFGRWSLLLANTNELRNRLINNQLSDVLLVLTYSAETPAWPSV